MVNYEIDALGHFQMLQERMDGWEWVIWQLRNSPYFDFDVDFDFYLDLDGWEWVILAIHSGNCVTPHIGGDIGMLFGVMCRGREPIYCGGFPHTTKFDIYLQMM